MSLSLPSPDMHGDWKSFARALIASLQSGDIQQEFVVSTLRSEIGEGGGGTGPGSGYPPTGYRRVWLSEADARLFLENPAYDPPTAADVVYIDTAAIANAAISTAKLGPLSVETSKIIDGAVSSLKLTDLAVTEAKVALSAITSSKLATGAVTTVKLAALSVDSAKLADLAVTGGKLVDGAVGSAKLADLAVSSAKINDAAITSAKIGLLAVNSAAIADLAVVEAKVGAAAIVEAKIGTAAVTSAKIGDAAIVNAKIADATILGAKLVDATIGTAKIGNGAIVTALIGDAQIVNAKIADLAVNTAKIANAAISSAKIANLAVGNAHIAGDISSFSWDAVTKAGWSINKSGSIEGRAITIYDNSGNVIFSANGFAGTVPWANVGNKPANVGALLGSEPIQNALITINANGTLSGAGGTAANQVNLSNLPGRVDRSSQTTGFGDFAAISLLSSGNISTYISGAAIGSALIANAAINTAHINNAAITSALIADAAIGTAKIADAAITNAKIQNLIVDKLTAGTLNAEISVGVGRIVYNNGTYMKVTGVGFGSANQFLEWFGPTMAVASCTEANAIQYLKTNGDAYFGGSLSAGTLTNKSTNSSTAVPVQTAIGPFGSNGKPKQVVLSYSYDGHQVTTTTCPVPLPTPSATLRLYKGAEGDTSVLLATLNVTGTTACADGFGQFEPGTFTQSMSGSTTYTDNSTSLGNFQYWGRLETRTTHSNGPAAISITQRVTVISTEQ